MTASEKSSKDTNFGFVPLLIAGGVAGTSVDIILYPLDTLKTRLQSKQGFLKSGGFSNFYKGITPVIIGSAPSASLFFVTYEGIKNIMEYRVSEKYHSFIHMGSASVAEMVACLIRVPVEVVKQRKQALTFDKKDVSLRRLYRGYLSTVLRDMPFSLIQFPVWERLKRVWGSHTEREILPVESAVCGAIAGGISAAMTTPLDVVKTRIMLSHRNESVSKMKILYVLKDVYKEKGLSGLFAGVSPRVIWITLGGFIFFGTYEKAKHLITKYCLSVPIVMKPDTKYQ
ncbi:S-adenosylmethionine mitochondrial carrier protein-like [Ceratina calcarata]|uniref:S-adenosylmethionine mitochondrial carrier protein-like n=1 Tax=Ceratina calcarata TaxID=156304 RepID=A0AAJ7N5Y6_9HYME|nr:S-adenosylmethionine mitochondrial carrier protein-like [Ceratina calcarata]